MPIEGCGRMRKRLVKAGSLIGLAAGWMLALAAPVVFAAPTSDGPTAVIFGPGVSADEALDIVARAGFAPLEFGPGTVIIASAGDHADHQELKRRALLVVDFGGAPICSSALKIKTAIRTETTYDDLA